MSKKLTAAKNDNGEFIEVSSDKTTITIHAKLYSEYVIAYQESNDENGGNGGSGGGDGSHTPSPRPTFRIRRRKTTGYRTCLKEGTCPIWPFTDAVPSAWYHDGVHYCIENGLMQGVSTAKVPAGRQHDPRAACHHPVAAGGEPRACLHGGFQRRRGWRVVCQGCPLGGRQRRGQGLR